MKNHIAQGQIAYPTSISEAQFVKLLNAGVITDGRMGGLVVGRTYDQGGIPVIFKFGCDYVVGMRVEDGEFIMNREASAFNHNRLSVMKSNLAPSEPKEGPLNNLHLIVTVAEPDDKMIWLDWGATAIPRDIADKHLGELFRLNRERNPYYKCDLLEAFCLKCAMPEDPLS
jgi:hypothetical protein